MKQITNARNKKIFLNDFPLYRSLKNRKKNNNMCKEE